MKILVKLPSRSRPSRCIDTIQNWMSLAADPGRITMLVAYHDDDETMNKPSVLDELRKLGAVVHEHRGTTKVQAINAGVEQAIDGHDILVLAADDMRCRVKGWDDRIRADMDRHWPNCDGALHYNDGHQYERLNTLPVMGANLYRKFGYIYHPDYVSLWCDNEYQDVIRDLGRMVYIPDCIIEHCHPIFNRGIKSDALLEHTDSFWEADRNTYERRKPIRFPLNILLSIGIVSLASRRPSLDFLLADLNSQINALKYSPMSVEIITEIDNGEAPTGEKRNRVLNRAKGRYISFIDDDDRVSANYCRLILDRIANVLPRADCIGIQGTMTTDGRDPRRWRHSRQNGLVWREEHGVYLRPPTHVNPVLLDLAKLAGFPDIRHGEDKEYSERLYPMLSVEYRIAEDIYYYDFRTRKPEGEPASCQKQNPPRSSTSRRRRGIPRRRRG